VVLQIKNQTKTPTLLLMIAL